MVFVFSIPLGWNPHALFILFCLPKADGGFMRIKYGYQIKIRLFTKVRYSYSVFHSHGTPMLYSCYFVCRRLMGVSYN
jgi:hypothetical protein